MIIEQIVIPQWVSLKQETRKTIANLLNLSKNGATEVVNGSVVCDGYTNEDLAAITIEKLQVYNMMKSGTLVENFNRLVEIVESPEPVEIKPFEGIREVTPQSKEVKEETIVGRVKKAAKKITKKKK